MKQTKTEQAIRDAFAAVTPDRLDDILADCGKTSKGAIHMESNHINKTPRTAPARRPGRMAYLAAAAATLVIVLTGVLIGTIAFRGRTAESAAANASSDAATPMPAVSTAPVAAATSAPNPLAPTPQPAASSAADQDSASRAISPEEATQIATAHAGHPNAEAVVSRSKPSVYEIRFTVGGIDYEYEIDARTGKILDFEWERTFDLRDSSGVSSLSSDQVKEALTAVLDSTSPTLTVIAPEAALQAAAVHSGIPAIDIEGMLTKFVLDYDAERNEAVYEIEFTAEDTDYEYEIDAVTGAIRKAEQEFAVQHFSEKGESVKATAAPASVTLDDAKQIALSHAGVKAADATFTKAKADTDDGKPVYDIEFVADGIEYDYEIDAVTGKVREFDAEPTRAQNSSSDKKTSGTAKPTAKPDSKSEATDIGASKAKSIALSHAGVSASDAKGLSCKAETENGRRVYDVEFKAGGYEYEYEIDAETGKILSREKEKDD